MTPKRPRPRTRYICVPLTPTQIQLLYVEIRNAADNCANAKLGREYRQIADKFNKHRIPL